MISRHKFDQAIRPNENTGLLKSSFRTTDMFEYFAHSTDAVTIGEISDQLKIPQSSVSSLVSSLLESGYLQRDNSGRGYLLSPRLALLGLKSLERYENISILRKYVVEIANEVEETTVLAIQNGLYSQYIYIEQKQWGEGISPAGSHVKLGSLRPLACSASGWSLMTQFSNDEIGKIIRATRLKIEDRHWEQNLAFAKEEIEKTRQRGYAFSKASRFSNTSGIAKLITNMSTGSLSICIAGTESSLKEKQSHIINALKIGRAHV